MTTTTLIDHHPDEPIPPRSFTRLVGAEFLKLRKRRGLVVTTLVLSVLPVIIRYSVLAILHSQDPRRHGPAGGVENFAGTIGTLGLFSVVAAILVGATLGTGDLDAGVFRELVITGRSRRALFAARAPAGLAILFAVVGTGFAITTAFAVGLAGSHGPIRTDHGMIVLGDIAPRATLILQAAGWLALVTAVSMMVALGISSLLGSRGTAIAVLLGWWLVAMPLLVAVRPIRPLMVYTALGRVQPPAVLRGGDLSLPLSATAVVLLAWTVVPLALGARRTCTRDT